MKKFTLFILLLFISASLFATHNKGAEITYRQIGAMSGFEYEITITTYTKTSSCPPACRPSLDSVHLGDGSIEVFYKTNEIFLPNGITINKYIKSHTYPGNGTYVIYFVDPNWNAAIVNITNSIGVPFCTASALVISNNFCRNNSITFGDIPIFFGQPYKSYIHNVAAIDADHDSLSFELVVPCLANTAGYWFPPGISINAISGQITWPIGATSNGEYALAVQVSEWRKRVFIGYVTRTYAVLISPGLDTTYYFTSPNLAADTTNDYYKQVNVVDTVNFKLKYYDADGPPLLTVYSEASVTGNPPTILISNGGLTDSATVTWIPDATHSRNYPYAFTFRGSYINGLITRQTDLTTLIYVSGSQHDSCYILSNVPVEAHRNQMIKIFPNPSSSEISIDVAVFQQNEIFKLTIYNIFGEVVRMETRNWLETIASGNKNVSLNIKVLPTGIYFLKLENKYGSLVGRFSKD